MRKIAVGVTGASGSIYADLLLKRLAEYHNTVETAVVYTHNAHTVWQEELRSESYKDHDYKVYANNDFYAPFASGSSSFDTLILIPCSMGTLARIAQGISDSLITRAADVMLKERKRLICVIRETPYNLIHIQNMEKVTAAGGIICPASPSFYSRPDSLEAAAMTVIDRVIKLAKIDHTGYKWGE